MANQIERRMAADVLEVRDDGDNVSLIGYASTFNEPYDMGWYTETVESSAFKRTLGRKPDVRLLLNHGGLPLARTTSGTLTLDTDSRGLRVEAGLDPSDPDVAAMVPKMRRGDLNQMSFAFRVDSDLWEDDFSKRTLRELDLNNGDVSVVTYPANPHATAALRSDGPSIESVTSALRALEERAASEEDVISVLTRALGYFTAIDSIVDDAQEEIAEHLGIPNPDDDDSEPMIPDDGARAASSEQAERLLRARARRLTLLG